MNLHWIDWTIVALFLAALAALAFYTKRYTKSVADFLVANRCAGRYLLTISQEMSGLGAMTFVMMFEVFYRSGFCASWWWIIKSPIFMLFTLSGWIIYRYRETRVMTMAQFFEIRYSRNFRVFCGLLAWVAGVINMGIWPAVTARFFIYFCGLPLTFSLFGFETSTFVVIMIIEISIALLFTLLGGMIVITITDFLQGIFCLAAFLIVLIPLYIMFDWSQVSEALRAAPENASMINPFKTSHAEGFNLWFFVFQIIIGIYAYRAWHGTQGYMAAAKNAHEAKMAQIIGSWRQLIQVLLLMMLPICAYVLMTHPDFASIAESVRVAVGSIENETIQDQMLVPVALSRMLPIGILGLFAAIMLASAITTDDTHLHSWGTIFIQDVILPFRKKTFTPKQHIWLLRWSITFVAVFIFFFSLLFRQNDFILMYFMLTGAIYIGGAGCVIIGGLYWKHSSTLGAWLGMITGSVLAFAGLLARQVWMDFAPMLMEYFPHWQFLRNNPEVFPYDGMQINIFAINGAIIAFISGSLASRFILRNPAFNLNKMLHRGPYAIQGEHTKNVTLPATGLKALLPSNEFTVWDKFLYYALTGWVLGWFVVFIIITAWHFLFGISDNWWLGFWKFKIWLTVILGIVTTVWFLIGGISDFRDLIRSLRTKVRQTQDDGRVSKK